MADVNEMNRTICEFMGGYQFRKVWFYVGPDGFEHEGGTFLKYHSDWNWLIPVVEKIEGIQMDKHGYFGIHIHSNACTIQGTKFRSELRDEVYYFDIYSDTKLNATWQAVYQFILWHNDQKQNL